LSGFGWEMIAVERGGKIRHPHLTSFPEYENGWLHGKEFAGQAL